MGERIRRPRVRVFFALWPPPEVASALHRLARDLRGLHGGRVLRRDTLHMTLAFVGDIERERVEQLVALGARIKPPRFELTLDRLGGWARQRLIWAAPSQSAPELSRCVEDLQQLLGEAGFRLDPRPFKPHLTLLRKVTEIPEITAIEAIVWPVSRFVLVESGRQADGIRYRLLADWSDVDKPQDG